MSGTIAVPSRSENSERVALVEAVKSWGYFETVMKHQRDLLAGRHLLDVGMGGGPLSVVAIEIAGCASYVGVDPAVGTDRVLDPRSQKDRSIPAYHAFPYGPDEIMRLYPDIRLYSNFLENVKEEVRAHRVDMAYMASVTEHLEHLPEVFGTIWECLEPKGRLWLTHHGYHSWTGHHKYPRTVADWDRNDPQHNKVVDWQHLEPTHACYADPNLNRVRMADFRRVVEKYFEIVQWRLTIDAKERLTPEIRQRYSMYSIEELLGRTVTVLAIRRDRPLDTNFSGIQFHHPPEDYRSDVSYIEDDISKHLRLGSVYFARPNLLASHSTNNYAAAQILSELAPGDRLRLVKYFSTIQCTVAEVRNPGGNHVSIAFREPQPDSVFDNNARDWWLSAVRCWQSFD